MSTPLLHGVIIVNKPAQMTSQAAVTRVKRILQVHKAGHTGTLDPFATGVLPVCINEGTKLSSFLVEHDKEYEGVLLLGVKTDTQDHTGTVLQRRDFSRLTPADIERAFAAFKGRIAQIPPMFSALKRDGVPLYELARQGLEVERASRTVTIHSFEMIWVTLPRVAFRVRCSKGTYVRTLADDLGESLGCGACLESLTRTRCGPFCLTTAIDLDSLQKIPMNEIREKLLLSPADALAWLPSVSVGAAAARKVRHGMPVVRDELSEEKAVLPEPGKQIKIVNENGVLLAIAKTLIREGDEGAGSSRQPVWKLLRVFNLSAE